MVKTPVLFALLSLLASANASAQIVFQPGQYRSVDGCVMTIERAADGVTGLRVDKGAAYVSARFKTMIVSRSEQILEISTCKSGFEFKVANDDQIARTYLTRCGGSLNVTDFKVYWAVSNADGSLLALRADNYIAKYSLPGGLHSGPIKTNLYPLSCQKFSRVR